MKRLIVLMLLAPLAFAQVKKVYSNEAYATADTTWHTFQRIWDYQKIVGFSADNDALTGNLWIAFNDDTTSGYRIVLGPGEGISWAGLSLTKIRVRSSTGTVTFRLRHW